MSNQQTAARISELSEKIHNQERDIHKLRIDLDAIQDRINAYKNGILSIPPSHQDAGPLKLKCVQAENDAREVSAHIENAQKELTTLMKDRKQCQERLQQNHAQLQREHERLQREQVRRQREHEQPQRNQQNLRSMVAHRQREQETVVVHRQQAQETVVMHRLLKQETVIERKQQNQQNAQREVVLHRRDQPHEKQQNVQHGESQKTQQDARRRQPQLNQQNTQHNVTAHKQDAGGKAAIEGRRK